MHTENIANAREGEKELARAWEGAWEGGREGSLPKICTQISQDLSPKLRQNLKQKPVPKSLYPKACSQAKACSQKSAPKSQPKAYPQKSVPQKPVPKSRNLPKSLTPKAEACPKISRDVCRKTCAKQTSDKTCQKKNCPPPPPKKKQIVENEIGVGECRTHDERRGAAKQGRGAGRTHERRTPGRTSKRYLQVGVFDKKKK